MPHWKEEQLQCLLNETDEQQLSALATSLAKQFGMEYLALTTHTHLPAQSPKVNIYNNYPKVWNERYQRCNYRSIDPIAIHCQTSMVPILWQDDVFEQSPEFWTASRNHGLCYGWSHATHDLHHNHSVLSVARSHTPVSIQEFYDIGGQTLWLCNLLHSLVFDRSKQTSPPHYHLSTRETEVLKWSAAGKTAADIACILSLSKSTVNFHIRSIISKLKSSNKTGAIAVAARNGLLD